MITVLDVTGKLAIDYRAREWCLRAYPGHPQGCPNFGKKQTCPPNAPLIEDWLDLTKQHWFVVNRFNFLSHVQRMKEKHPEWSERQCRCVLYWQGSTKKALREFCLTFVREHPNMIFSLVPEAMGVHVLRTARLLGIPIRARPNEFVYKIALIGHQKNS
ncbi:MAG: hypothetical protein ACFFBD_16400 [Candidatus Hodarchaeota archaeon]